MKRKLSILFNAPLTAAQLKEFGDSLAKYKAPTKDPMPTYKRTTGRRFRIIG